MDRSHLISTKVVSSLMALLMACSPALAQTVAASPAGAAQVSTVPDEVKDKGWPRQFETKDYLVRVHQPQVDEWPNFDRISFRAAVVVTPKGTNEPAYGIIVVSAKTDVAFEERLVVLTDRKVEKLDFPGASAEEAERLKKIVMEAVPPQKPQTVSLDRIIAEVDLSKANVRKVDVNLAPPKIYTSDKPAVMVIFLGKPRFKPAPGGELLFAVNTNWDVFLDSSTSKYYLLNEGSWLVTSDLEKGPWTPTMALPAALSKLPPDENWADVRAAVPGKPANQVTAVFVSREPAELIVTKGAAEMEPIPDTKLMLVSNTESDLFYTPAEKQFYLLAAGRWFKAAALAGPWSASSTSLPEDFKKIPEDSDAADVLASVPGTPAANEAVIMASIPNKATVNKNEVTVNVTYTGTPNFRPIETTTVQYAYNSPFNVFLVEGKYYCCHNAVWFVAPTPTGVWTVSTLVPAAIYTIPPSSPKYNVTYVYVYDSTPTTVTTSYTSGYSGATVAATGAVMFGIGMLVGAAIANDDDDCYAYHYSAHYYSYGCGAHWNGASCGYVSAGRVYGPYGGAGGFAAYNPATGGYSRGAYAYGPNGAAGYRAAYNPATGNSGVRAGATTPYGSWSRGAVSNGDDWVRGGRATNAKGGSAGAIQSSQGGSLAHAEGRYGNGATVGKTEDGDIYAGKDGNVYKKSDGGWEQERSSQRSQYDTNSAQQSAQRANQNASGQRAAAGQPSNTSGGGRSGGGSNALASAQPSNTSTGGRSGGGSNPSASAQPTNSSARGSGASGGQGSRASAEQSQYLQQQSSSRQRGEQNATRSRQSRSSSSGGGRRGR